MSIQEDKAYLSGLLNTRAVLKQDIYAKTKDWFLVLKEQLGVITEYLKKEVKDERVRLRLEDTSDTEARLYIGSDVIVFAMHTNVFKFSNADAAMKNSYVKNDPNNAYCGVIQIYNFLADSYQYNRPNDIGYLIGRLFINKEDHFLIEGKRQLSFLYRDFMHQELSAEKLHEVIYKVAITAIDFELLNPPYENVAATTVYELQTLSHSSQLKTGKRLGFKFSSDMDMKG